MYPASNPWLSHLGIPYHTAGFRPPQNRAQPRHTLNELHFPQSRGKVTSVNRLEAENSLLDKNPNFTTLHIRHGGLSYAWEKIPKTIEDAILLVSRLGERYVWIDSLCIVQNSLISWSNNASVMHLIYGHAHFTICAADGDSETGLRAAEPLLRTRNSMHRTSEDHDVTENSSSEPLSIIEYAPGTRILAMRPLEVVIYDSVWSKRAWTFQEQILSRRCLIFAEGRIYFQCRFVGISEDIWTDSNGNGWSLNRTNSTLQSPEEFERRPIWFYMRYVRLYTSRNLTKPSDILSAFEGITWLFQGHMNREPFLFGLPSSHFDLALLWVPTKPLIRRRRQRVTRPSDNNNWAQGDLLGGAEFPSWAWCGWMGEKGTSGQAVYHEDMLEGSLLNIRRWLEHHTWIEWFIRDTKGHLKPLRNTRTQVGGRERYDEDRWNGYAGSKDWTPVIEDAFKIEGPRDSNEFDTMNSIERGIHRSPPLIRGVLSSSRRHTSPQRTRRTLTKSNQPTRSSTESNEPQDLSDHQVTRKISFHVGNGAYLRRGSTMEPRRKPRHKDAFSPVIPGYPQEIERFTAIIPNNPLGTIRDDEPISRPAESNQEEVPPLVPIPILQFYTWLTELHVTVCGSPNGAEKASFQKRLLRCDIADDAGDWCGSIEVSDEWISGHENQRFHFIAVSDAKAFTKDERATWTYYIPKEMEESQWDLYYVLLLERDDDRCLWERVALGKVFKAAFENANWSEIKLG